MNKPRKSFVGEALGNAPPFEDIPPAETLGEFGLSHDAVPDFMALSPVLSATPPDTSQAALSIADWRQRDLPAPDLILGHWLTTTSRVMLVADTGLGKTNFAIALGMAVSAGRSFLHWEARRRCRVLYIDGEMSRRLLRKRVIDAADRLGIDPDGFHALSHEDIEGFAPLNTPAGQACIEKLISDRKGFDLIIFDSIMCLLAGDMKDEEPWQQMLPWVRSLTRRGIGQIFVHHTGHDKSRSYGTKTREWQLDTVVHLEAVERPDTDVSFALEFKKARERTPDNRADFQLVTIALVDDHWHGTAGVAASKSAKPPTGIAGDLLGVIRRAIEELGEVNVYGVPNGLRSVNRANLKIMCRTMAWQDQDERPDSFRALLGKYLMTLRSAGHIGFGPDWIWLT